jgi:hypothetical protein
MKNLFIAFCLLFVMNMQAQVPGNPAHINQPVQTFTVTKNLEVIPTHDIRIMQNGNIQIHNYQQGIPSAFPSQVVRPNNTNQQQLNNVLSVPNSNQIKSTSYNFRE